MCPQIGSLPALAIALVPTALALEAQSIHIPKPTATLVVPDTPATIKHQLLGPLIHGRQRLYPGSTYSKEVEGSSLLSQRPGTKEWHNNREENRQRLYPDSRLEERQREAEERLRRREERLQREAEERLRRREERLQREAEERLRRREERLQRETEERLRNQWITPSPPSQSQIVKRVEGGLVYIGTSNGSGSGFIYRDDGYVVTNAHVVGRESFVTVRLVDGQSYWGQVLRRDKTTDLAVIKINSSRRFQPMQLGNAGSIDRGDTVIALGFPFGDALGRDYTATWGRVSSRRTHNGVAWIQTDASINPGNSGGPLLNRSGQVIGVNTAIYGDANGIGFAVSVAEVRKKLAFWASNGDRREATRIARPFVGIQMRTLSREIIWQINQDPYSAILLPEVPGVLIVDVLPNTPASASGLRPGDVITKIDGRVIVSADQLGNYIQQSQVGQLLSFELIRNNQTYRSLVRTGRLDR